ncbi:MAG TPA: alanine racemase [Massilibacterium sp.]|nr:alanine racemase [Massilibacterium sp.]
MEIGQYYRNTWAEIDLDAIKYNIQQVKKNLKKETHLFAVVKANAYGHGAKEVAQVALESGADYLAVALLDEAIELREHGIDAPILILGPIRPADVKIAAKYDVTVTVFQAEWVKKASQFLYNQSVNIHIKVDSGMGRIGIRSKQEAYELVAELKQHPEFRVEGLFTHFATADAKDLTYFHHQVHTFKEMIRWFAEWQFNIPIVHISNSAATLRFPSLQYNGVRFGISMYGLSPSLEMKKELPFALKPALSLHTKITHIKRLKKGEKVSYGATYEAKEDEWIATVPIGYADGWIRKLSNSEVLVEGERVPIVGRICMDQMMIAVKKERPLDTVVTLIGQQGKEEITTDEVAKRLETINYEITCMISARVPRVFVKNRQVYQIENAILTQIPRENRDIGEN